ncbi:MAG: bifunctional DNA-formamidopyrimidine glycosylase/DNA-(apurinic or apyrimidinic site) lyase [Patescibacteria group bacterium]|nr:bifunctional DNA-formamidopyrimidine glycosylase/DNA-(apurinic or apyrimidinic site) lyase [Patescibacteria group bacterium]
MPELPEVETIKRDLENNVIRKTITSVQVLKNNSVKNSVQTFKNILRFNQIKNIERKGKYLAFEFKKDHNFLIIHLRMTGQLIYSKKDIQNKHTRVIIHFKDHSKLYFNDIRRFGYLQIVNKKDKELIFDKLGIDPTDKGFTYEFLNTILKSKKSSLKSVLLNQNIISGIGNIYADEICFDAKLKPYRKTNALNPKEVLRLFNSIRKILDLAIKHRGTSFSDYVDANGKMGNFTKHLKVYKKERERCANCNNYSITKLKIAGRMTRFCKNCQR